MSNDTLTPPTTGATPAERNVNLTKQLHLANGKKLRRSLLLISPLLIFVVVCFLFPLISVLSMSVSNPELSESLPQTSAALQHWDGKNLPDEPLYQTLFQELGLARQNGSLPAVAKRMSYEEASYRRLILNTARLKQATGNEIKNTLIASQPAWGNIATWRSLQRATQPYTAYYLLAAFDHKVDPASGLTVALPDNQALYVNVLLRTLWMATMVTLFCVGLGYPLAYWLSKQPANRANLLMILVLLPFWTSLIVRTASWIVLLQSGGLINRTLMSLGMTDHPLPLVFNRIGVYISMTHILLPFIVLPLYAVMKGISPSYVRAAISLGAHPFLAFWRVYVPQTYAGITAGALLVFMMAIGYYITPALLGGPNDQMISYFVAFFTNSTMNWGMAAALGSQLLVIVLLLYIVYIRVTRTSPAAAIH